MAFNSLMGTAAMYLVKICLGLHPLMDRLVFVYYLMQIDDFYKFYSQCLMKCVLDYR